MRKEVIKIVFASDNNFVKPLAVSIASVLLNSNKSDSFEFFVLTSDITNENKEKIAKLKKIKDFEITYLSIDEKDFEICPLCKHFKLPTYFRLKLPSLLNEDKVLYLDCDILVLKSLKELFIINIDNYYCAAVEDITKETQSTRAQMEILDVKDYFNAGILLLNLKKMREGSIEPKCFDYIENNSDKIKNVDQSVLNVVFKNNVLFVENLWNFQYNSSVLDIKSRFYKNLSKIRILHFACEKKPWDFNNLHPATLLWYHYLSKTPYRISLFQVLKGLLMGFFKKIKTTFNILNY